MSAPTSARGQLAAEVRAGLEAQISPRIRAVVNTTQTQCRGTELAFDDDTKLLLAASWTIEQPEDSPKYIEENTILRDKNSGLKAEINYSEETDMENANILKAAKDILACEELKDVSLKARLRLVELMEILDEIELEDGETAAKPGNADLDTNDSRLEDGSMARPTSSEKSNAQV